MSEQSEDDSEIKDSSRSGPLDVDAAARRLHEFLTSRVESSVSSFEEQVLASDQNKKIEGMYASACNSAKAGEIRQAIAILLETCSLEDKLLRALLPSANEDQRLWLADRTHNSISALLSLMCRSGGKATNTAVQAYHFVLRRKALTEEAANMIIAAVRRSSNPKLKDLYEKLRQQRNVIANETMEGVRRAETAYLTTLRIGLLKQRREQLEREIASCLPPGELTDIVTSVSVDEIAELLPEGAVLVEFVQFKPGAFADVEASPACDRLVAFLLRSREPESLQWVDLGEALEAEGMIRDWLRSLSFPLSRTTGATPMGSECGIGSESLGEKLRERLFDPLRCCLGGLSRLFIAADGAISFLPFEALPLEDGGCLIDRFDISYLTTARDLLRWTSTTQKMNSDIVIGGPDFDLGLPPEERGESTHTAVQGMAWYRPVELPLSLDFEPLPGAEREARLVGAALGSQAWVGCDALKGRLDTECHSPRILHIATHGFFLRRNDPTTHGNWSTDLEPTPTAAAVKPAYVPKFDEVWNHGPVTHEVPGLNDPMARSGLALAAARTWLRLGDPPQEAGNGLLTAHDAMNLDLHGTKLVVLSGCETAVGDLIRGEGVFGMRRSFILAGAETVIASRWRVADDVTEQLMLHFYRNLLEGMGRADALRAASNLIRQTHPEPFYWAAFICLGNPYSIPGTNTQFGCQ